MEYRFEREIINYVVEDVSNKAGIPITFEYLPPDLQLKIKMAASYYKKKKSLRNLIADCEKKLRRIIVLNRDKILQELNSYNKEYNALNEKYQQIIEEIVSKLRQMYLNSGPKFQPFSP